MANPFYGEATAREMPSAYLTEGQFCRRYNVSSRTVQRWRVTGDGPAWVRLGRRRIGYRLTDCEAWAAARTYAHRADELTGARKAAGTSTNPCS